MRASLTRRAPTKGYTIVELLVSIAIGLFLDGGLVTLLVTNSINSAEELKARLPPLITLTCKNLNVLVSALSHSEGGKNGDQT